MNLRIVLLTAAWCCILSRGVAQTQPSQPPAFDPNAAGVTLREFAENLETLAAAEPDSEEEGGSNAAVNAFTGLWNGRVSKNPSASLTMFNEYQTALRTDVAARYAAPPNSCGTGGFQGAWKCLGPDGLTGSNYGYVETVWADPNNADYLLAGTYGGIFKTTDGGAHWANITDRSPFSAGLFTVTSFAVHPTNNNIIYAGTGIKISGFEAMNLHGAGGFLAGALLRSTDGGQNWTQEIVGTSQASSEYFKPVQKVFFTPDGAYLIAFKMDRVYIRPTNGSTWSEITTSTNNPLGSTGDHMWTDLDFVPGDPNANTHFYASTTNWAGAAVGNVYEFSYSSGQWSITPLISLGPGNNSVNLDYCLRVEISIPDNQYLFAAFINEIDRSVPSTSANYYNAKALVRFDLSTKTPTVINANPNWNTFQLRNGFIVTPQKVQATVNGPFNYNIYIAGNQLSQSYDGGQTFHTIARYFGDPTHGDVRDICLHTATSSLRGKDDVLFIATDGGVAKKGAGRDAGVLLDYTCTDISGTGLVCANTWGVSTSEAGGLVLTAGQHNGVWTYEPGKNPPWVHMSDGDGGITLMDEADKTKGYITSGFNQYYDMTVPSGGYAMGGLNATGQTFPYETGIMKYPMVATKANNHYAGQQSLLVKAAGGTTWGSVSTNATLPNYNSGLPFLSATTIRAVAFDLNATGVKPVGYVAFDPTDDPNQSADSKKLWFRASAGNFVGKTLPAGAAGRPIMDITVDPNNVYRVWIAMGGLTDINLPHQNKVFYSSDAGTTWYDVSVYLPSQVPVTSIVYQEGSNNLYAATDVGIFKMDFTNFDPSSYLAGTSINTSVRWTCFNKPLVSTDPEFPNIVVTKLAINYCSGRLYAATYGRGIWSTSLSDPANPDIPTQTTTINSSTTWNTTQYLKASVRVKTGATLTISGSTTKIYMPSTGQIYVEPGAQLVVDGATLTNGCKDCLWAGIVGEGKSNLAQTPANQAKIVVRNGATIEHARNAITTWGGVDSKSGAIVDASNSYFKNNRRAIEFMKFYNGNPMYPSPNVSRITGCSFSLDNSYKGTAQAYYFSAFISMWEVKGIQLIGNSFTNSNTTAGNFGVGLRTYNASFNVIPGCNSPLYPCNNYIYNVFTGLKHGIEADGDDLDLNTFTVDRAKFYTCGAGIYAHNVQNLKAIRSEFHVGNTLFPYIGNCNNNYGIRMLDGCNGSIVEQNSFTQGAGGNGTDLYGATVENTGYNTISGSITSIYGNTFSNMSYAVYATGVNGSYIAHGPFSYAQGAKVECNTFASNYEDLTIANNGQIQTFQGSAALSAGNVFQTGGKLYNNNTNSFTNYLRYYHTNGNTLPQISTGTAFYTASSANTCPVHYSDGGSRFVDRLPSQVFAAVLDAWKGRVGEWETAIDGGSTANLLTAINNTTPGTVDALQNQLLSLSPYVSETALRAVGTGDKLPFDKYLDVLQANPDVLRHADFIDFLATGLENPFPEDAIQNLQDAGATITVRGTHEADIQELYDSLMVTSSDWLSSIAADSTGAGQDSISYIYLNTPSLPARYALAARYLLQNEFRKCDDVMATIPSDFQLTPAQNDEYSTYDSLWTVLKTMDLSQRDGAALSDPQRTQLTSLAARTGGGAATADAIVSVYRGDATREKLCSYRSPVLVGQKLAGSRAATGGSWKSPTATVNQVLVLPNPAKDVVAVTYSLPVTKGAVVFRVTATQGQVVKSLPLDGKQGRLTWDVRSLAPGTYFYQVTDGTRMLTTGKLVILH